MVTKYILTLRWSSNPLRSANVCPAMPHFLMLLSLWLLLLHECSHHREGHLAFPVGVTRCRGKIRTDSYERNDTSTTTPATTERLRHLRPFGTVGATLGISHSTRVASRRINPILCSLRNVAASYCFFFFFQIYRYGNNGSFERGQILWSERKRINTITQKHPPIQYSSTNARPAYAIVPGRNNRLLYFD